MVSFVQHYSTASGRITLSREQFTKVQDICNDIAATIEDTTVQLDASSESYLNVTKDRVNTSGADLHEDREGDVSDVLSRSDGLQYLMSSTIGPNNGNNIFISFWSPP